MHNPSSLTTIYQNPHTLGSRHNIGFIFIIVSKKEADYD